MTFSDPLTWAILLMLAGLALAVLEVFVPSGGLLGFLAATAVLSSVGIGLYSRGAATGFGLAAFAVVVLPAVMALALKYWPETPMGRRFLLGLPTQEEVLPDQAERQRLKLLLGKIGHAKTAMLPSGAISIEGRTYDALSQGMPIDPGQPVKVVDVHGLAVVVRPYDPGEDEPAGESDDPLSQSLEQLGLDPLGDPLA